MAKIRLETLLKEDGEGAIPHVSGQGNYVGTLVVLDDYPYVKSDGRGDYLVETGHRITLRRKDGTSIPYDVI